MHNFRSSFWVFIVASNLSLLSVFASQARHIFLCFTVGHFTVGQGSLTVAAFVDIIYL